MTVPAKLVPASASASAVPSPTMSVAPPRASHPAEAPVAFEGTAALPAPGLVFCRHLGQGRSSQETLVRDAVTQRQWVLKEYLPPALAARRGEEVALRAPAAKALFDQGRASFVDEALWLAGVRHPALRRVHRVWQAQGTAFALLAPVEGTTLLRHLAGLPREQQVPEEAWLVTFLRDVASALQVMHHAGRLHRGVHPGEVVVTASGRGILLGLSTMQLRRADGAPLFADGLRDGFAAPEQYGPASAQPQGPWTDLYALAAIAYGLMTGVALDPAPRRAAATGAALAARLAPLSRLPAGRFNAQLVQGIERTLALAPSRRPQSVSEFLAATGLTPRRPDANAAPLQFLFEMPRTEQSELADDEQAPRGADLEPDSCLDLDLDAVVAAAPLRAPAVPSDPARQPPSAPAGWLDPTLLDL